MEQGDPKAWWDRLDDLSAWFRLQIKSVLKYLLYCCVNGVFRFWPAVLMASTPKRWLPLAKLMVVLSWLLRRCHHQYRGERPTSSVNPTVLNMSPAGQLLAFEATVKLAS